MKINALFLSFCLFSVLYGQEAADKKVQAGIAFGYGLNLNKTATKKMATAGVGSDLNVGVAVNYKWTNTIGLSTGLNIDFETNKVRPTSETGPSYYQFSDTKILFNEDAQPSNDIFQWTERTQKPIYLTVPMEILFRTKFFGYMRYYGKFGLRTSFLMGNKINDVGYTFENNSLAGKQIESENTTMKAARDMNFLRSNVGFTFGAEWNFSGPTSLIAEMGYYYGFVPIYRDNKDDKRTLYFYDIKNQGTKTYYSNDMTQSQFHIKIGILF